MSKNIELIGEYMNGNTHVRIFSDGTKIRETEDDEFKPAFAENMDIKICNKCTHPVTGGPTCAFCHEGSTPNGGVPNLRHPLIRSVIKSLHPYQEVALGGGNILEQPDLIYLLLKLKQKKVFANVTLNQLHFEKNFDLVKDLIDSKLIYGLGISLVNPTDEFIEKVKEIPNSVIHVINGVVPLAFLRKLRGENLKVLILGYKELRRGIEYQEKHKDLVNTDKAILDSYLPDIIHDHWFKVVSFDNLALEQLHVKNLLTEEQWNEFYAGDDGTITYYIDLVNKQFARSSTAPFDKRYPLMDNVDDMFNFIREGN